MIRSFSSLAIEHKNMARKQRAVAPGSEAAAADQGVEASLSRAPAVSTNERILHEIQSIYVDRESMVAFIRTFCHGC
jgi:hypothetical protein